MRRFSTILLDDGGVMNDNTIRGAEWQRLVGEFLAPRLGAAPEAWAEANDVVFRQMWGEFEDLLLPILAADSDTYVDFFGDQRARWLRDMCERVGVTAPDEAECHALGLETEQFVLPRVRSGYPGAADAIRRLQDTGYRLRTASGQTSAELEGYLTGLGVRDLFPERLYGPDLVGAMKGTTAYYERVVADAQLDPAETLVADDQPGVLARAAAIGLTTVLVGHPLAHGHKAHFVIARLADLPALLESHATS
jgi:phosphoglycolate phosphatase-like HAD superfamily hydrolase